MGLFSISDLVISLTLFVNAIALLASSPKPKGKMGSKNSSISLQQQASPQFEHLETGAQKEQDESTVPLKSDPGSNGNDEFKDAATGDQSNGSSESQMTIQQRFEHLVDSIRRASGIIVLWNIFYAILLILVFRG